MGLIDLILFPAYLLVFYFIFSARRKKLDDPVLQYYHRQGFWIKALMVLPFAIFNSRISPGDSFVLFQAEGYNIYTLILKNTSNIHWLFAPGSEYDNSGLLRDSLTHGYHSDEKNFLIVRITAVISFLTFGRYLLNCLVFSLISYTGVWKLYRFFYEQYPHLHKQLAIAILYLPTFVFWCSGILKDPLCIGAIGWLTYSMYEGFVKKKAFLKNIIIILFSAYVLVLLKIYILVAYLPFLVLFLVLKNLGMTRNFFGKLLILLAVSIGVLAGGAKVMSTLRDSMKEFAGTSVVKNIQERQKGFKDQESYAQSNFSLGVEFDGSLTSMLKVAPAAIIATLYRPFLWESRSFSTLLTSFESFALIIFTIYCIWTLGIINFFRGMKDPAVLYCFAFSVLFALFVGATTLNFGTLCRYKIPCMPFYVLALVLMLDKSGKIKLKKRHTLH